VQQTRLSIQGVRKIGKMSNLLWKSLVVSPAVLGATLLVSATAIAAPTTTTQKAIQTETLQTEKSQAPSTEALQADKLEVVPTVDKLEASINTSKGIVFPTCRYSSCPKSRSSSSTKEYSIFNIYRHYSC
jgi:hypothetical protein